MTEDQILTQVTLDAVLARLDPEEAAMIRLVYELEMPDDWTHRWPPTYESIGTYIGLKFKGKALSEAAIRYRVKAVEDMWAGKRGKLRRNRR